MKRNKGFTLVRLLVVVVIVGVLVAIVLALLNDAKSKAANGKMIDAKVQSQLVNMHALAERVFDGTKYGVSTAKNGCSNTVVTSGLTGNNVISGLMSPTVWPNGVVPDCTSNATAGGKITMYSMWHALSGNGNIGWCVDSSGASIKTTKPVAGKNCAGKSL